MLSASIAVARAESFFEIPIIGRFFKPAAEEGRDRREVERLPVEAATPGKSGKAAKPCPPAESTAPGDPGTPARSGPPSSSSM
jgi:hypothetical protein